MPRAYVIGAGGLVPLADGPSLPILPNRIYHHGSSSSPDSIYVTRVTDTRISYHSYPYGGTSEQTHERDITEYLIKEGCQTQIQNLLNYEKSSLIRKAGLRLPEWMNLLIIDYRNLLEGNNTLPEVDRMDYVPMLAIVRCTNRDCRDNDPWYHCETYGGVSSTKDDLGTLYHIHCYAKDVKQMKLDPTITIVETKQRPPLG